MAKTESKVVSFRDFERNNEDVKKAEHLKLPLNRIKKKKGFNPRDLSKPETQEKIQAIKLAYKTGQYVPPPLVKMAPDGDHVEIVDGECRYTAAELADAELKAEGLPGILALEVMRFAGNDKEALVQTVLSNEGERLTPLEQSEVVRRLLAMGLDREKVSNELHKSIGWIDRLIVIAKLPERVKQLVREGKIAPEVAVKFVKEHGEEGAEAAILATLKAAGEKGEGKVTAKHTKKSKGGDSDGDGGDGNTPKVNFKKERLEAAKDVAFFMPKTITRKKPENIKDDVEISVTLTGAAVKALLKLQALYEEEFSETSEE